MYQEPTVKSLVAKTLKRLTTVKRSDVVGPTDTLGITYVRIPDDTSLRRMGRVVLV